VVGSSLNILGKAYINLSQENRLDIKKSLLDNVVKREALKDR
jgi:hypothetical protein